jgi:peptidoglycan biosynthesis protein MviN/MurJ (putative lipid II flippase)
MKNDASVIIVPVVIGYVVLTLVPGVLGKVIPSPFNYVLGGMAGLLAGFVIYRTRLKLSRGEKESGVMRKVMLAVSGLVIAAGVALFGLAFWLEGELHGFMAFPQIVGFLGIVITLVGIANLRRLRTK